MASLMARMFNWEASRAKYKPHEIVDRLRFSEGDVVADIGSGGGFFAYLFADKVGSSGRVYAVDTNRNNLGYIRTQADKKGLENIQTVPVGGDLPDIPGGAIDKVFARNVFHHLKDPVSYFSRIRKFLKPGGKVVIIDHAEKTRGVFVGLFGHHTSEEQIVDTMDKAGFKLSERSDFLSGQSFLVFGLAD